MICDFTSFSTVFQSYQNDGRLIMKGCVQWNYVYGWEDFASSRDQTRSARSVGQGLTHWAIGAPGAIKKEVVETPAHKIFSYRVYKSLWLNLHGKLPSQCTVPGNQFVQPKKSQSSLQIFSFDAKKVSWVDRLQFFLFSMFLSSKPKIYDLHHDKKVPYIMDGWKDVLRFYVL